LRFAKNMSVTILATIIIVSLFIGCETKEIWDPTARTVNTATSIGTEAAQVLETTKTIKPTSIPATSKPAEASAPPLPEVKTLPSTVPSTALPNLSTETKFTINPTLCNDNQGPSCTELRLGDDYFTTSLPEKGYLYSCTGKNPNAPGSRENKITWIDFAGKTWNFLQKLWLPETTSDFDHGSYTEILSGLTREITINNLPVDGKIGDWPMTAYPILTEIDANPGIPASQKSSLSYSSNPEKEVTPTCVSLGAIGVTKNGVVIYNAADARGEDAVAREIVDVFGGHPAGSSYHYHFIPERLDNESLGDGHSGIVGYINDGFPIYGYKGVDGNEMSNDDLDVCHGHDHGSLGYHYHATIEYPYTVGCYKGTPSSVESNQIQPGGASNGPPRIRP
jgi:hypothetical protein